jgi:hypothetical protein
MSLDNEFFEAFLMIALTRISIFIAVVGVVVLIILIIKRIEKGKKK